LGRASKKKAKQHSPFSGFLPFFWLAIASLAGIFLASLTHIPIWVWILGFCTSLLIYGLTLALPKNLNFTHMLRKWTRSDHKLPGLILCAIFFLGGWRFAATRPVISPEHIAFYNDRGMVQLIGILIKPPDPRDNHINLIVEVDSLRLLDQELSDFASNEISGRILIQTQTWEDFTYGDQLMITGQLVSPIEGANFSYQDYLARKGILSLMPYAKVEIIASGQGKPIQSFLFQLRSTGYETLHSLFPSPESDLLAGILLGRDQGLSSELQEAFHKTGTTHIIAISGFNIAILAGIFCGVSTRLFGRRWGTLMAVIAIAGYTILVGGDAAVVRAAIMGGLGVLGGMFGRRQNGLNSLGLAAMAMLLLDPNLLWDIGFQLSAAATLGLVFYAQPLEEKLIQLASKRMNEDHAVKIVGIASELFLFTLCAQVMTLPIIAYHFGGITWLALIANPLILPVQSLVLLLGGLAMLTGMIMPGLGKAAAILVAPFVSYTIRMVTWVAHLPGGDLILHEFSVLWLLVYYLILFLLTLVPRQQRRTIYQKVLSYQTGLIILAASVFLIWTRVLSIPDDNLHLTLLDTEGTILVQSPSGNSVLIGGGKSPSHLKQLLGQFLPTYKQGLNTVIVGSAARDDLNALVDGLHYTPVEIVLWGVDPEINQTSRAVYSALIDRDIPVTNMDIGQSLDLGDGVTLEILWVGERGAVLWLKMDDFSAILPTGKVGEYWLTPPTPPQALLLPDDLKAETLPIDLLKIWSPQVLLLPLEEADLPLQGEYELFSLLVDYPVLHTLEYDWVRVSTDGQQLWVNGR